MSELVDLRQEYKSQSQFYVFDLDKEPNKWYVFRDVKYKIINYLQNREFCMLSPKHIRGVNDRMMRVHNVQSFDFMLKFHDVLFGKKKSLNQYYSLAKYQKGIPYRNPKSPYSEQSKEFSEWLENHWEQMVAYDFVLDIDAHDHKYINDAYRSSVLIKDFFDKREIPYELRFSGCGFHFIVHYENFSNVDGFDFGKEKNIYNQYKRLAKKLNKKFSNMIDETIYDSRRVIKIPYSIVFYQDEKYLCLPLNDFCFENFDLEMMKIRQNAVLNFQHFVFNSKNIGKKFDMEKLINSKIT